VTEEQLQVDQHADADKNSPSRMSRNGRMSASI
jgi:hypothetical protein